MNLPDDSMLGWLRGGISVASAFALVVAYFILNVFVESNVRHVLEDHGWDSFLSWGVHKVRPLRESRWFWIIFGLILGAFLMVWLLPEIAVISPPSPIALPSSLRLLFPPDGKPEELEKTNIQWQAYPVEGTTLVVPSRPIGILSGPECESGKPSIGGLCEVKTKSLLLLLQFDQPTIYKKLIATIDGKDATQFTVEEMSPSYAVLNFSDYPSGEVLDVRTENDEAKR